MSSYVTLYLLRHRCRNLLMLNHWLWQTWYKAITCHLLQQILLYFASLASHLIFHSTVNWILNNLYTAFSDAWFLHIVYIVLYTLSCTITILHIAPLAFGPLLPNKFIDWLNIIRLYPVLRINVATKIFYLVHLERNRNRNKCFF